MNNDLKIFNVTNRTDPLLDELYCQPAGVGNEDFPKNYLKCNSYPHELFVASILWPCRAVGSSPQIPRI